VALDRKGQILRRHPVAVVRDPDQFPAAPGEHDLDAPAAGVEGVLDQFLDDACGPLDHLAGGDAVGQRL